MRAVVRAMSASAASGTVGSGGSGKLAAAAAVARLQLLAASIEDASSEADPLPPTAICQRLPPTYAAGKTDAKSLLATIDSQRQEPPSEFIRVAFEELKNAGSSSWKTLTSAYALRRNLSEQERSQLRQALGSVASNLPPLLGDAEALEAASAAELKDVGRQVAQQMVQTTMQAAASEDAAIYRFAVPTPDAAEGNTRRGCFAVTADGHVIGWHSFVVWT